MTQQGVQRGRFWVTEDVDSETGTNDVMPQLADPSMNKSQTTGGMRKEMSSNSLQGLSVETQPVKSGVQRKGRFFVVNDTGEEQQKPQISSETESLTETPVSSVAPTQNFQVPPPNQTEGTIIAKPQKQQHEPLLRRDNSASSETSIPPNQSDTQSVPANGVQRKGRFFVVNEVAEESKKGYLSEGDTMGDIHQALQANQIQSLQPSQASFQEQGQLRDNSREKAEPLEKSGSGEGDVLMMRPLSTGLQKRGRFIVASEEPDEAVTAQGMSSHVQQQVPIQGAQNVQHAGPQQTGAPPTGTHQKKTVISELQRISSQNHRLHHMLRDLMKHSGIPISTPHRSSGPTNVTAQNVNSQPVGAAEMRSDDKRRGAQGVPKQHAASAADPVYLQGILGEVTHGTQNLIMEYNTLKQKNRILNRQLADTKTQLKEAQATIENLRSQVAKYRDQKSINAITKNES